VIKEIVLISGISGAGKSVALNYLEDHGYFCMDNLPLILVPKFIQLITAQKKDLKIGIVFDIRERVFLKSFKKVLKYLERNRIKYKLIFFDADNEELLRRFKSTRRRPPLYEKKVSILESIKRERVFLREIREKATFVIDTTDYSPVVLKEKLKEIFFPSDLFKISIIGFSYRFGIPKDADLVFDVRCLPNPYYEEKLSSLTGKNKKVKDYIFTKKKTKEFVKRLKHFLDFSIPLFEKEGKNVVIIAFGCTGGRHRSVAVSDEIGRYLKKKNYRVSISYRDI